MNAMEQILPKCFFAHTRFQIAVGRDYDANIDRDRLIAANAFDFAFFEDAQQLGLHVQGHVADFIEKYRSLISLLEFANVATGGAGERSFFVSEQFGLDQLRRHGGAIQSDERPSGARTSFVNGSRHAPVEP